jgi:hypothetical protein
MLEIMEKTAKQYPEQLRPFMFRPGQSGNPKGRQPGPTMKEFARKFLMGMTNAEKIEFMNSLPGEVVWKMAEGQPHQTTDLTSAKEKIEFTVKLTDDHAPPQTE